MKFLLLDRLLVDEFAPYSEGNGTGLDEGSCILEVYPAGGHEKNLWKRTPEGLQIFRTS